MSASKNESKHARQHSIASANASSDASQTGLAVQPPVVQLSIQEEDENQPQTENQIQKTKEYSANPNGDDPGNTPPANPNQGNGHGKGNLPFQLNTSSETQPIHSFLSGKSSERSTAVMQQGPDAVHQFLNGNFSVLQKVDEEESNEDTAVIRRGTTTTIEQRSDYDISGTYREVSTALAARSEAGSITTSFSDIAYESTDGRTLKIDLQVTIIKSMPNWTNFQADYVAKAANESIAYRAHYQRVVEVWNTFYAALNAHEEQHRSIDLALYGNAHTGLIGMTMSHANEELDAIEARASEAHEAFHDGEGGHMDALPYIQQPGEERVPENSESIQQHKSENPNASKVTRENNYDEFQQDRNHRTITHAVLPINSLLSVNSPATSQNAIQRKVEGGVEVGTSGVKVNLGISTTKEFKMKYAIGSITPKAIGVGELKPTQDHPGSVSGSKDGAKTSINVYTREATEQGSAKLGEMVHKEIESNWIVEDVEWENELGKGENEKGMGSASMATGVKFIFKNGHEVVVKAQLFEKSAGAGLSGPKFTVEPTFKFQNNTLWENEHAKLTYNGEFSVDMSIAPNWSEIFKYLAKKGSRVVARLFAKAAMTGAAGALVTGGMIAGGALAVFATVQSIIHAGQIKACRKQAELAPYSYVRGWCTAWGINEYGASGIPEFVSKGSADAHVRLIEEVKKIQKNPVFAHWDFTLEELIPLMKEKLPAYAPKVFQQVYDEVRDPIYRDFVVNFYYQSKNWYTPISITRKNAIWLANGLGLKDAEQLVPKE